MRILFITDLYPIREDEKTTPKTLYNFVKEWENQGHTIDIIKPNFILNSFLRKKPFYKTGKYENVYNINYWTPFWFNIKKKIPALSHYDLIIAHMPSGILFADKLGLPFVAGVHNSDLEVLTNPLYKFHFKKRLKKALYNAKAIACRSFVIKDKLLKLYPEFKNKVFVAPSGIDEGIIKEQENKSVSCHYEEGYGLPDEVIQPACINNYKKLDCFTKVRNDNNINFSTIKILTCAKLIKRKNIDKIINACKNLDNFELTVIGDGKLKKQLEKLDKKVIFTGWLKPEDVYKKMRESDIFVLPSINETFGMVYLEAMAQGCITICTRNDGIAGVIKDGENGFLVEPEINEIKNLLIKIQNLDKNIIEKIKINSINTVKDFTLKKCAENYLQQILKIF